MQSLEATVLLISPDEALCSAVRAALERCEPACRVAAVSSFAAARHTVEDLSPDVIVLEECAVRPSREAASMKPSPLEDIVASLAGYAPVVVLGERLAPAGLSALIAAGAADFVEAAESHLPAAAHCVEKRLRNAKRLSSEPDGAACGIALPLENFGELLRHELNNPLTGILGNAELLLAEVRKQKGAKLPESGQKRLETIAALAVRMRETVRRLSQECESRRKPVRSG